jgi:chemotaxis protein methyltransferase CheR
VTDLAPAAAGLPALRPREFQQFRRLAYEKFGLDLRDGKEALVSARLSKKIRELSFRSYDQYYRYILDDQSGEALAGLIDALTTNHTSFFREPAHFEFLRRIVRSQLESNQRLTIWSAACSTGEEPYSIAFSLVEELGQGALTRVRILATDISTKALAGGYRAIYPAQSFSGIPVHQLRQYLLRGERRWKGWYQVKPQIRAIVDFRRLNLIDSFAGLGVFSVIFCRNVMIYFDKATQESLLKRLAGCLQPGGYLFVGHAESLNGGDHALRYVAPAVYRKPLSISGREAERGYR